MARTLTLRKEVLASLSDAELAGVVGAGLLTDPCITRPVTGIWCLYTEAVCFERTGR
jgi:hypothetical protein